VDRILKKGVPVILYVFSRKFSSNRKEKFPVESIVKEKLSQNNFWSKVFRATFLSEQTPVDIMLVKSRPVDATLGEAVPVDSELILQKTFQ
jgi:hypothetical protein